MPPSVKAPIRIAAHRVADAMEPKLIDLIQRVIITAESEKNDITMGINPHGFSNTLATATEQYINCKHAVATLKFIAAEGLQSEEILHGDLPNILNAGHHSSWRLTAQDRAFLKPLIDFTDDYGHEIAAEGLRRCQTDGRGKKEVQDAQAEFKASIGDFESRFGADKPKT